ncbi:MAG TPA: hypothetical protein VM925_17160 [Labilithrix sp.]|nr:hypothetical protein [Labilithrix sp.]
MTRTSAPSSVAGEGPRAYSVIVGRTLFAIVIVAVAACTSSSPDDDSPATSAALGRGSSCEEAGGTCSITQYPNPRANCHGQVVDLGHYCSGNHVCCVPLDASSAAAAAEESPDCARADGKCLANDGTCGARVIKGVDCGEGRLCCEKTNEVTERWGPYSCGDFDCAPYSECCWCGRGYNWCMPVYPGLPSGSCFCPH